MKSVARESSVAGKYVNRFQQLAGSLETLIAEMAQDWENAASVPVCADDGEKPVHKKIRKAQLLFSELHATTRKTHNAIEGFRKQVSKSKQNMDKNQLQLENLLYERDHLLRETQLCRHFTMTELNKMEDAEDQAFLEDVDTLQTDEEHAQNLVTLKEQKEKRINAQVELAQMQIKVKAVNAAMTETKQYLEKLPDFLKDVEKSLVPLKKNMPWRPGARRGRHEQVAGLPGPLFTLYCQLEAYCDSLLSDDARCEEYESAADSGLLSVVGGEKEAQVVPPHASVSLVVARTYVSPSARAAAEGADETSSSSRSNGRASPAPAHDGVSAKRQKRYHGRGNEGSNGNAPDGARSKREAGRAILESLKPWPTEVLLTLNLKDGQSVQDPNASQGGASGSHGHSKGKGKSALSSKKDTDTLSLRFCYLSHLGIVAVCYPAGWSSSLLTNLFPNDTGRDTPNPANHHGPAARASVHGVFKFPADVPCRPYRWVQGLAGLHFPPAGGTGRASVGAEGAKPAALEPSTRAVVAALRSRAQTHMKLSSQLKTIAESGPVSLPTFDDKLMRTNGNVELRSWKELLGSELQEALKVFEGKPAQPPSNVKEGSTQRSPASVAGQAAPCTLEGDASVRDEWERFGSRYFRGVLKRGRGKEAHVEVHVEVPAEYPLRPSRLVLTKYSGSGSKANAPDYMAVEDLRTITTEVNAHYDTLLTEDPRCWDHLLSHQLVLAMACLAPSVDGFTGRLRRGRMRRKPVVFDRLQRAFIHR